MSPALAITAVLVLHIVALLPLLWAAFRPAIFGAVGIGYAALLVGIATYQTGAPGGVALPPMEGISATTPTMTGGQCDEILSLLDQAGLFIDRRSPPRLIVRASRWAQLPQEGQDAVAACVRRTWPDDAPATQIETRP